MDKHETQTFLLSVNDFGQKICTSQSEPNRKYILDDDGSMTEYQPETSICALKLDSQGNITEEDSNDTSVSESNEVAHLEDPTHLGIMNTLDGVADFEENLMNELDSDFMNMVPNPQPLYIMQHMDIRDPLTKLRKLIENRLGVSLQNYTFALQGAQTLEGHKNLVEQCVQGEGLVQVNAQIQANLKRINIIDVLKPAEDYVHMEDGDVDDPQEKDIEKPVRTDQEQNSRSVVQWQVDLNYRRVQERLKIPSDPEEWSPVHVRHWVQWAVRQFNLPNIKLNDWTMSGKELHNLTIHEFQNIVPSDPGDIFWTHLELLRKMKVVATKREEPSKRSMPKIMTPHKATFKKGVKVLNYPTALHYFDPATYSSSGIRTGNNGQIQLWQFLLELLTTREYRSVIQWIGKEGEFKLNHPEVVAHLWGDRKNKPTMNYEKLSRALRYYYDGDMISKVPGKRYFRNNPFKAISNVFRSYKKSCENFFKKDRIKRNQSEPLVAQQRATEGDGHPYNCKPKSEVNLPVSSRSFCGAPLEDWSNSKFDDNSSQESLRLTWSNSRFTRSPSNISISEKNRHLDLNIQDKLNQMPVRDLDFDADICEQRMTLKRSYPWQNFNLSDARKSRYEKIRSVGSLTDEMIKFRKSILRKNEAKSSSALKEVKFNKMASMMVYPKNTFGVMKQARINLSTNVNRGDKSGRKRKVKDTTALNSTKLNNLGHNQSGIYCEKSLGDKDECPHTNEDNLWYFEKKHKFY